MSYLTNPNLEMVSNNFSKGMTTDVDFREQPEGTYRYALNAVRETLSGDSPSLANELGNEAVIDIVEVAGVEHTILGVEQITEDEFIVFTVTSNNSFIFRINTKTGTREDIVQKIDPLATQCLNFNKCNPIRTQHRILGGDTIVYFTDDLNPVRSINIDRMDLYLDPAGEFDCCKITLVPSVSSVPSFENLRVLDSGGSNVAYGSYRFAVRMLDENSNPTNWLYVSTPAFITRNQINGSIYAPKGGKNIGDGQTSGQGRFSATNKSIEVELANLDQNFTFYQIASIQYTAETGQPGDVYIHPQRSITGTTATFIYTGTSNATLGALEDIAVDSVLVNRAKDLTIIDNSLVIANTSEDQFDWAAVQRAVNDNIDLRWASTPVPIGAGDFNVTTDEYTFFRGSFMQDEIQGFGIQGRRKDGGSLTPVFHIPGRDTLIVSALDAGEQAGGPITAGTFEHWYRDEVPNALDNIDTKLLDVVDTGTVTDPDSEVELACVKHLGFTAITDDIGDGVGRVQRWKVYNTYTSIQQPNGTQFNGVDVYTVGRMGYYITETPYPDTIVDGLRVFPTGNVRHHKMPPRFLNIHVDRLNVTTSAAATSMEDNLSTSFSIYTDLTNFIAALPQEIQDEVISWEIVKARRDASNTTVVSCGILRQQDDNKDVGLSGVGGITAFDYYDDVYNFYSADTLIAQNNLNADYVSLISVHNSQEIQTLTPAELDNWDVYFGVRWQSMCRNSSSSLVLQPTNTVNGRTILVNSALNPLLLDKPVQHTRSIKSAIYLDYAPPLYPDTLSTYNVSIPTLTDVHGDREVWNRFYSIPLYSTVFEDYWDLPTATGALLGPEHTTEGRTDSGITYYVAYKRYNPNVFSEILDLEYESFTNNANYTNNTLMFGQESFVGRVGVREKWTTEQDVPYQSYVAGNFPEFLTESRVNANYRTEGGGDVKQVFNLSPGGFGAFWNVVDLFDPDQTENDPLIYQDWLDYNTDYSYNQSVKSNFSLGLTYDYTQRTEEFPFRIIYSDRSYQEQSFDNFKVFSANNFRDLDGTKGEITTTFKQNDELYVLTERTAYFVPLRPQTIETNENTAFIGTGDRLSVPPKELFSLAFSYAGTVHPLTAITTPFGTVWANTEYGTVFRLSDSLSEISNGMAKFFKENLVEKLKCQLEERLGVTFACLTPFSGSTTDNTVAAGLMATYDSCNHRYIITKRDFQIREPFLSTLTLFSPTSNVGDFVYDADNNVFGIVQAGLILNELNLINDTDYFEDCSFTMSYHFPSESWTSFHSYLPDYLFNDSRTFYSFLINDAEFKINKHNQGNYTTFNGTYYPFEVETVLTKQKLSSQVYKNLLVKLESFSFNTVDEFEVNNLTDFFTSGILYTEDNATGNLVFAEETNNPYLGITTNANATPVFRSDRIWRLNGLLNNKDGDPVFTTNWDDILPTRATKGYVDKIINDNAFTGTTSIYDLGKLTGTYLGVRLTYDNQLGNNKLLLHSIMTTVKDEHR